MGSLLEPLWQGLLALLLFSAVVIDVRSRRIPNVLTLTGCLAGLVLAALAGGLAGFWPSLQGLLLAFALTLPFWLLGWFGAGDVKLLSAVGAFVGVDLVMPVLLATGLAGALLAAVVLLDRGLLAQTRQRLAATLGLSMAARRWVYVAPGEQEQQARLPYAVAIAAGTLVALWWFG